MSNNTSSSSTVHAMIPSSPSPNNKQHHHHQQQQQQLFSSSSSTPEEQMVHSIVTSLLNGKTVFDTNDEVVNTLNTLQRLFLNIISEPDEPKYRRIRKSNAAIQRTVFSNPAAVKLLFLFGFEEDPSNNDYVHLPTDKAYNETVAMIVMDTAVRIEQETAQRLEMERTKALQEANHRRENERMEKERLKKLIEEERLDRKERSSFVKPTNSGCCNPSSSPSSIKTYKDIGIDLNRKKGG